MIWLFTYLRENQTTSFKNWSRNKQLISHHFHHQYTITSRYCITKTRDCMWASGKSKLLYYCFLIYAWIFIYVPCTNNMCHTNLQKQKRHWYTRSCLYHLQNATVTKKYRISYRSAIKPIEKYKLIYLADINVCLFTSGPIPTSGTIVVFKNWNRKLQVGSCHFVPSEQFTFEKVQHHIQIQ